MSAHHRRALIAAWLLLATQIVHGFIPAKTHHHSAVGPVVGLVFLAANVAAIVALHRRRAVGATLLRATSAAVIGGFVLYHALPWRTSFTRPYIGEPVGVPAWFGVGIVLAWATFAFVASRRSRRCAGEGFDPVFMCVADSC